jgi:hypothetical protein
LQRREQASDELWLFDVFIPSFFYLCLQ